MARTKKAEQNTVSEDFSEIGDLGLKRTAQGTVEEEVLQKLRGLSGVKIFTEMEQSDIVSAGLFVIEMLARQVEWRTRPASTDPADIEAADFLYSAMNDMSQTWISFVCEALSIVPYGWSYHEIVYKRRNGDSDDPTQRSKYNDGRIGWRKLPIRAQSSLLRWEFDESGGVKGMWQTRPTDYASVFIPIEKALLFRSTERRGNPEGRSALRGAYKPWRRMNKIEDLEGIGVERDLAGLPTGYVPSAILDKSANAKQVALRNYLKAVIQNIRRDEQEGVLWPSDRDDKGNLIYDLKLLSTGGARQFDTDKISNRYARRILMTMLADFIMLGHEKVGSLALSDSKTDIFATALGAWLDMIQDVLNVFAVPRLFKLNSFSVASLPQIVHGDIETPNLQEVAQLITSMSGAGAMLFPDDRLENALRRYAGLPEKAGEQ